MRYLKWAWRSWPVLIIILTSVIHFLLYRKFGSSWPGLNKAVGSFTQITGGIVVIYSINDNIGAFRKYGIGRLFLNYMRDFPQKRQPINLSASFTTQMNLSTSLSSIEVKKDKNLEERMFEIELAVERCMRLIVKTERETLDRIDQLKKESQALFDSHSGNLRDLTLRIEQIFVGGVRWQLFGVFLVVYGALVAYFS